MNRPRAAISPRRLTIEREEPRSKMHIEFTGNPLLVSYRQSKAKTEVESAAMETFIKCDGNAIVSERPAPPDATWLFFRKKVLLAVVKLDAWELPATEPKCRHVWPIVLVAADSGVVKGGMLSNLVRLRGGFVSVVVTFNEALVGTDAFWKPLADAYHEFPPEEADVIRQVATARGCPPEPNEPYDIDFDKHVLFVAGKPRELTPNQNGTIRYFWNDKQSQGRQYFHTSFQEAATALEIRSRNMNQVFKVGQRRGGNLDIMRLLFKKSSGDHWILAADMRPRDA